MAKKIPCPKCGKQCGPTYLDRHLLTCVGTTPGTDTIETQELEGLNTTRANIISELLDVTEPKLNDDGDIEEGEDLDSDEQEEETDEDVSESSAFAVIGLIVVVGVIVISMGAFLFRRSTHE